jgi:hypothetical protein
MLIARTVEESRIFLLPELRVAPAKPLHNQCRALGPTQRISSAVSLSSTPSTSGVSSPFCDRQSRSGLSARRPGHRHRQDSTLGRSLDRTDQQRCYLDPISLIRRLNRGQVNTRWKAARRLGVDGESEEAPGDVRAKSRGCKQPVEIGFDPPTGRKRAAVLATPQGATWRTQSLRHGWRDGRP